MGDAVLSEICVTDCSGSQVIRASGESGGNAPLCSLHGDAAMLTEKEAGKKVRDGVHLAARTCLANRGRMDSSAAFPFTTVYYMTHELRAACMGQLSRRLPPPSQTSLNNRARRSAPGLRHIE